MTFLWHEDNLNRGGIERILQTRHCEWFVRVLLVLIYSSFTSNWITLKFYLFSSFKVIEDSVDKMICCINKINNINKSVCYRERLKLEIVDILRWMSTHTKYAGERPKYLLIRTFPGICRYTQISFGRSKR